MSYPQMTVEPDGMNLKVLVAGETVPEYMNLGKILAVNGEYVDFRTVLAPATQTVAVGLDDMTISGKNESNRVTSLYEVVISDEDTPDDFQWRRLTNGAWTDFSADIAMTGSPQELEDGIFIDFAATTGHTADDAWQFTVKEKTEMTKGDIYPWDEMFRVFIDFQNGGRFYFDTQQVTNQTLWVATKAGLAVAVSDVQNWIP